MGFRKVILFQVMAPVGVGFILAVWDYGGSIGFFGVPY